MRNTHELILHLRNEVEHGKSFEPDMCKHMVLDAFDIPSNGSPDATTAYRAAIHKFKNLWVPGVIAWWTGGSHGHGHAAITAYRKGFVFTVDDPRHGHWNRIPLTEINHDWGLTFAGFSLDIDGHKVRDFPPIHRRRIYP